MSFNLASCSSAVTRVRPKTFAVAAMKPSAGSVLSWSDGTLAPELSGAHGHVILRLTCSGNPVTKEEGSAVAPDGDFSSQNPIMQKMNPTVGEIEWVFQSRQ